MGIALHTGVVKLQRRLHPVSPRSSSSSSTFFTRFSDSSHSLSSLISITSRYLITSWIEDQMKPTGFLLFINANPLFKAISFTAHAMHARDLKFCMEVRVVSNFRTLKPIYLGLLVTPRTSMQNFKGMGLKKGLALNKSEEICFSEKR